MLKLLSVVVSLPLLAAAQNNELRSIAEQEVATLLPLYRDLHSHPELSHHEARTSGVIAGELRKLGFEVTEHVGKYPDGSQAFGVVAVMKNGPGPVLMLRTELDALPVVEKTGLPFASQNGAMHACGHDLHMTSFLGTAQMMAKLKSRWSGTLMMIGQPSEETIDGARAMLADGLYTRFPKPDYVIGLHDDPGIETGMIGMRSGPFYAAATSVEVRIRGVGGHGAHPEATKDPVVMAAEYILELQTIVSRQMLPLDPAVVTVGSIHGGSKNNIIPDEVVLELTVRAFTEDARERILASISRMAKGIALAAGVPEDRAPVVKVSDTEVTPPTYNDPKLAARVRRAVSAAIGENNIVESERIMVSEDFGQLGLKNHEIPTTLFELGALSHERIEEGRKGIKPVPSLHSAVFYPDIEPALRTGIIATTAAALDILTK